MLKKMIYKGLFLKGDVENILQNMNDAVQVKNILDSVHPMYYENIFGQLKEQVKIERLLEQPAFRQNANLYDQFYLDQDVALLIENLHEREKVKEIIALIPKNFVELVYEELLAVLPDELAVKYAPYSKFVQQKQSLAFLIEGNEEGNLQEKIDRLEEEIRLLKNNQSNEATKAPTEKEDEDETEEFGKEIFG